MGETKKDILLRVYLVYIFICLFGLAIVVKIWHLQYVEGDYWRAKADSLTTKLQNIEPSRGNIYSSDGSLLATSVPIYDLRVDMMTETITKNIFNENVDSLSILLSRLFNDRSPAEYKTALREARHDGERYYLLKKNVSYNNYQKVRTFPIFRMGRYKGGLIAEQKNKRVKPFSLLAERTIGYKMDGVEPVGIEGAFDAQLKGTVGMRLMQKISGNVWKPLNDENEIEPRDGNDIVTTIDLNLQDVAENSLYTELSRHDAEKGCAILMEVETGAVMAIANLKKGVDGNYHEEFNFGVGESTEPGSTFKLASVMALLEDGYAQPTDSVDTQGGAVRYANRIMKDSHEGGYGKTSLQHVFEVSSNVGISKMVYKFYAKNPSDFTDRVKGFGLGEKMNLQITGEGRPFIVDPSMKQWSKVSLPYLSIGYGCSFTPLQILTFYNAIANNGKMVKPMFVREIKNKGQLVHKYNPTIIKDSIASPATIRQVQSMLEGVVQNGTATNLKHGQYKIAGKTGTAQIANAKDGYKNGKVKYQASFVGYFPADNPKYSCIVVVYAPNGGLYYAASVAGPIFKEIADKVYSTNIELHKELGAEENLAQNLPVVKSGQTKPTQKVIKQLNIPVGSVEGQSNWVAVKNDGDALEMNSIKFRTDMVPSVIGMGLRDAIYVLESKGLQVRIIGKGAVLKQSITPGAKIEKGSEIVIQLG
jgi:cell division protein FtsI (penicillin-binding protein 3)